MRTFFCFTEICQPFGPRACSGTDSLSLRKGRHSFLPDFCPCPHNRRTLLPPRGKTAGDGRASLLIPTRSIDPHTRSRALDTPCEPLRDAFFPSPFFFLLCPLFRLFLELLVAFRAIPSGPSLPAFLLAVEGDTGSSRLFRLFLAEHTC